MKIKSLILTALIGFMSAGCFGPVAHEMGENEYRCLNEFSPQSATRDYSQKKMNYCINAAKDLGKDASVLEEYRELMDSKLSSATETIHEYLKPYHQNFKDNISFNVKIKDKTGLLKYLYDIEDVKAQIDRDYWRHGIDLILDAGRIENYGSKVDDGEIDASYYIAHIDYVFWKINFNPFQTKRNGHRVVIPTFKSLDEVIEKTKKINESIKNGVLDTELERDFKESAEYYKYYHFHGRIKSGYGRFYSKVHNDKIWYSVEGFDEVEIPYEPNKKVKVPLGVTIEHVDIDDRIEPLILNLSDKALSIDFALHYDTRDGFISVRAVSITNKTDDFIVISSFASYLDKDVYSSRPVIEMAPHTTTTNITTIYSGEGAFSWLESIFRSITREEAEEDTEEDLESGQIANIGYAVNYQVKNGSAPRTIKKSYNFSRVEILKRMLGIKK